MNPKWKFSAHGNSFRGKSHVEIGAICKKAGFQSIELSAKTLGFVAENKGEDIKETYENQGIAIATFHLPYTHNDEMSSFYEAERDQAVQNIKIWMRIARRLGAGTGIAPPR